VAAHTRRDFFGRAAALLAAVHGGEEPEAGIGIDVIAAPSNLGLRPPAPGKEPGAWRAPEALLAAGLAGTLPARRVRALARPPYRFAAQPGTRIRNGLEIRSFSESLAREVAASLSQGAFPLVVGGDCSVLLGGLLGARRSGCRGLVHVDGHSDFFQLRGGSSGPLGAVAGMDLALATGRGEALLTKWPAVDGPLAADADTIQIGERDARDPDFEKFYPGLVRSKITRMTVQEVLENGVARAAASAVRRLEERNLARAWLHVDLDVLDASVLPAVDSPGSPGLSLAQLSSLIRSLTESGRIAGAEATIYDPDLDRTGRHARELAVCLGEGLGPAAEPAGRSFTPPGTEAPDRRGGT
jgi:arginase